VALGEGCTAAKAFAKPVHSAKQSAAVTPWALFHDHGAKGGESRGRREIADEEMSRPRR
jgi:hypothetical protein